MSSERLPRRLVTGLREDGVSYVARDEELHEIDYDRTGKARPRQTAYPNWDQGERPIARIVWGQEELPFVLPNDPMETPPGVHPKATGVRISMMTYPPGWVGEMIWSNRVDVIFVLSGELTYATDDGNETVVYPGDVVIQNGTNKAFHNRGDVPVTLGCVLMGAIRRGTMPPVERYHGTPEELER